MPDVRKQFGDAGLDVIGSSPAEFADVIRTEIPYWAKIIKEAGIKARVTDPLVRSARSARLESSAILRETLRILRKRARAGGMRTRSRFLLALSLLAPARPARRTIPTARSASSSASRRAARPTSRRACSRRSSTEAWSVPVTVENIPGGGGSVGAERVGKSAPDGYTLYWGANGAMTINPSLQPNPAFDPQRDLAPIARLLVSPSILAVNNDVPAKRSPS